MYEAIVKALQVTSPKVLKSEEDPDAGATAQHVLRNLQGLAAKEKVEAIEAAKRAKVVDAKGKVEDTAAVSFSASGSDAVVVSETDPEADAARAMSGKSSSSKGPKEEQPSPMTPITTANTTNVLAEKVERQRDNLQRAHQINSIESQYTYQLMDKQGSEIRMLKETLSRIQEKVNKMRPQEAQAFEINTPVSKHLHFTPGKG